LEAGNEILRGIRPMRLIAPIRDEAQEGEREREREREKRTRGQR